VDIPIAAGASLVERMAAGLGPRPASTSRAAEAPGRAASGILEVLEEFGTPATVATVAGRTGQHVNTVREHLDALVGAQLVERTPQPASGRGRPAWLYAVVASDAPRAPEYAGLATALAMQLAATSPDPERDAAHAGEAWGRRLAADDPSARRTAAAARRGAVEVLDRLGFEPTTDDRATTARLTRCPLLDAAKEQPDVVCSVHLGIVRGALDAWGAPDEPAALVPFAEPGACLLHLGRAAVSRRTDRGATPR
jgi:predicted ArsR family transcriptional regulator